MANAVIGALRVTLGLDSAEFTNGINRANRATGNFAKQGRVFETAARGMTTALRGVSAALGITSIAAAGRAYLSLADQSKQMTAQLKLATQEMGSFGRAQEDVKRIAAETRSGLSETTVLYSRFLIASKDLGRSQDEAARATETYNKALIISGATTAEAQGSTRQFIQALQSGVLRGEEFNSVMENSPRMARLLAQSLNVPIGSLRSMAEEGSLTSEKLMRALTDRKFTELIDREFKELPVTFEQSMQLVSNAATITFGAFDDGGEFSKMLANFIVGGADGFAQLETSARDFGINTRAQLAGLRSVFFPMEEAGHEMYDGLDQRAKLHVDYIRDILRLWDQSANFARDLVIPKAVRMSLGTDTPIASAEGRYSAAVEKEALELRRRLIMRGDPFRDFPRAGPRRPALDSGGGSPTGGGARRASSGRAGASQADRDASAAARLIDSLLSDQGERNRIAKEFEELDKFLAAKLISPENYTAARDRLHQQLSDLEQEIDEKRGLIFDPKNLSGFEEIDRRIEAELQAISAAFEKTRDTGSEAMLDLVNNTLNALSNLERAVKNGGFLGILSAGFNAFGSLSQSGLFGGGLQNTFRDFRGITGFSTGGSFRVGGMAGTDRNLIAFRASKGEMVDIRKPGQERGSGIAAIVPSPLFDVVIDGRVVQTAGPMSIAAAKGGALGAQQAISRRNSRTIP